MSWVLGVFILSLAIQLFYYLRVFSCIGSQDIAPRLNKPFEPVSVIICARNEAENLKVHLPRICQQDYPVFEVLVVLDRCNDESYAVLESLAKQFSNLRFVEHLEDKIAGKKAALKFGIENSKYELLLLSDADCYPASMKWIAETVEHFDSKTDIVLGFGAYEKTNGFLNAFIQYETYLTALQYFSWSLAGNTYMGVGRNLAYRKSAFESSKQFSDSLEIASGDDDLLVQQMAEHDNTAVNLSQNAITISKAPERISDWWRQKARHLSTGTSYKNSIKWKLGLFSLSQVALFASGLFLLVTLFWSTPKIWLLVAGLLCFRWLIMVSVQIQNEKNLPFRNRLIFLPILDFCFFVYLVVFAPLLFYRPNKKSWNNKWIDSYN